MTPPGTRGANRIALPLPLLASIPSPMITPFLAATEGPVPPRPEPGSSQQGASTEAPFEWYATDPRAEVPEAPAGEKPEPRSPLQRVVLALLLVATAALIGYVVSRPSTDSQSPNALARSAEAAEDLYPVLDTEDPLEARQFVRSEFGWRVGVPLFGQGPRLRGVAVARVAPAVEVPVFLYDDDAGEATVFVYSYALFDQVPDRLRLTRGDYDDLAGAAPVLRHSEDRTILLWRDRDDIYVAVVNGEPERLADGLTTVR